MKKTVLFIMTTIIIIFIFAACGSSDTTPNSSQAPESVADESLAASETHDNTGEISVVAEGEETMQTTQDTQNKNIEMVIGEVVITAALDDSEIARQFADMLPQTIPMTRGRDREYYGRIDGILTYDEKDIQRIAEDGDLAYWFSGNSLAFFFNTENDSAVNSGIVVLGKIISDVSVFDDMEGSITMTVALSE